MVINMIISLITPINWWPYLSKTLIVVVVCCCHYSWSLWLLWWWWLWSLCSLWWYLASVCRHRDIPAWSLLWLLIVVIFNGHFYRHCSPCTSKRGPTELQNNATRKHLHNAMMICLACCLCLFFFFVWLGCFVVVGLLSLLSLLLLLWLLSMVVNGCR